MPSPNRSRIATPKPAGTRRATSWTKLNRSDDRANSPLATMYAQRAKAPAMPTCLARYR